MVSRERHRKLQQRIDKTGQPRKAAVEANSNSTVSIVMGKIACGLDQIRR